MDVIKPRPSEWNISFNLELLNPLKIMEFWFRMMYQILQFFIIMAFKPMPPKNPGRLKEPYGNIAVIGAGLSGVSSAAHAIAHNFDVTLYESNPQVGGIWSHVNSTSSLQINSLLYRFHPAVHWSRPYPYRDEILKEIRRVWEEYQLQSRTKLNTPVTSVTRASSSTSPEEYGHGRWIINEIDGPYDAVIVTVGACGKAKKIKFTGEEKFQGKIVHSSELDDLDLQDKRVVVVGSGASGIEAAELAVVKNAKCPTVILARDDKWIIPRNIFIDTMLAAQPFGRQTPLSFIPEWFIKLFHYRDLKTLAPYNTGLFESTPVVNNSFLSHIRQRKAIYLRGDTQEMVEHGIKVTERGHGTKQGDMGKTRTLDADVIVLATGFERPSLDFLPEDLFPKRYQRPSLYLQNFSTEDWSVLLTNSAYMNAIGESGSLLGMPCVSTHNRYRVSKISPPPSNIARKMLPRRGSRGHFHIGIYTRILLAFLLDRNLRPLPEDMKLWVDALRFLKRGSRTEALSFFTYMELTIWFILWHLFKLERLWWMFFIMQGWGSDRVCTKGKLVK